MINCILKTHTGSTCFAERQLAIEIKSSERLAPVHFKQVMTYLKLSSLKNGLLLNFNVERMKDGFHRVFNNDGK
jgi:GxxExxY protein